MNVNRDVVSKGGVKTTISYSKQFIWEIENFVEWWSSRPVAESFRSNTTSWEEEVGVGQPKSWEQASGSPFFTFDINGDNHQFRIDVLRFDSWDRFDDEHNQMMGISLFYAGPWESIPVKSLFSIKDNGIHFDYASNKVQELKRGENSYARVFADHSIASNLNQILNPHFKICCFVQVDILQDDLSKESLKNKNERQNSNFNRALHHELNFTATNGCFNQSSDFEIVCVDQTENKEKFETTLYCHRIVLCLGSEYYQKMLSSNFIECNGKVVVTDVSSSTMIKVLQYLYVGDISESDADIDLLYAADKYEIAKLQAFSESIILKRLNIETVFDVALAANNCGSKNFKDCVSRFLCKHWKNIREDKRSQMFLNNAEILREILNQM